MLSVYTEYITIENLASYYVNTPDPFLECPPFEQRLIIGWAIPDYIPLEFEARIIFTIRFRNREQVTKEFGIRKRHGRYMFRLSKESYFENGGILTYKVELSNGDEVLEEWKHQLWAELILFEIPDEDADVDDDDEDGDIDDADIDEDEHDGDSVEDENSNN